MLKKYIKTFSLFQQINNHDYSAARLERKVIKLYDNIRIIRKRAFEHAFS